ncbi:hypothetical protein N9K43_02535 [Candidatus Poseidoniales archaeon]|nr:hypothetical protein [Candidatus Poseidoniales archaeon]
MVELPQGDVTEIRRGDREALRLLSADIANDWFHPYRTKAKG